MEESKQRHYGVGMRKERGRCLDMRKTCYPNPVTIDTLFGLISQMQSTQNLRMFNGTDCRSDTTASRCCPESR